MVFATEKVRKFDINNKNPGDDKKNPRDENSPF